LVAQFGVAALPVGDLDPGLLGERVDPLFGQRLVLGVVDQQLVGLVGTRARGCTEDDGDGEDNCGDPAPTSSHPGKSFRIHAFS
jgi:hypothetical protein